MTYSPRFALGSESGCRWPIYGSCVLLLVFLTLCLASMPDMASTADEGWYYSMGLEALSGTIRSSSMQRTPIGLFNAAAAEAFRLTPVADHQRFLFVARIPTVLAALLLGFYVMLWARRLYGPPGMLLSLFLFAFCPNTIAHSRLITSDIYFTLFCFMSVYHLVRYLTDGKNSDYGLLVLSLGMAVVAKQTAVLLGIILPVVVWRYCFSDRRVSGRLSFSRLGGAVLGCLFILNAAYGYYPFSFTIPPNAYFSPSWRIFLPVPQVFVDAFLDGMRYNRAGWPAYLLGEYSRDGWWYYFPVLFVFKEPVAYLVMLFSRVFLCRTGGREEQARQLDLFAIMISILVIVLFFALVCRVNIGIRYVLPLYPFLFVYVGRVGEDFWSRKSILPRVAVVLLCVWYAMSSISYFPFFLSYGSDLIVNRNYLYKYFADSNLDWGQNTIYLTRYADQMKAEGREVHIDPRTPVQGLVAVDADFLLDVWGEKHDRCAWLLNKYQPIGNVAYGWIIFDTTAKTDADKTEGKSSP